MRNTTLSLFLYLFLVPTYGQETIFPEMEGQELLENLVRDYKTINVLDYGEARDFIYGELDNVNDTVRGIYTNHAIYLPPNMDPSTFLYMDGISSGINAEHVYPQSKGATGNARSDMHHLFPSRSGVNSARGNLPFGEVVDNETRNWYYLNDSQKDVPTIDIDEWSEQGRNAFEPREDVKGNVARAMFYFYTMYQEQADAADPQFFEVQREQLCEWHILDPVDLDELVRTASVALFQDDKANPFVLDCSLAARSYCWEILSDCALLPQMTVSTDDIQDSLDLDIYPNPSSGQVTIRYSVKNRVTTTITVINSLGQVVKRIIEDNLIEEQTKAIDLPTGIYTVSVVQETDDQLYEGKEKIIVHR